MPAKSVKNYMYIIRMRLWERNKEEGGIEEEDKGRQGGRGEGR